MNILIIGSGAREHAIARAFKKSRQHPAIFCFGASVNQGIKEICAGWARGDIADAQKVCQFARENNIDFAFVGPEAPLEAGVVDALRDADILAIGPTKKLAQLETSKSFTRNLLSKHRVPGGPKYEYFYDMNGAPEFIKSLGNEYVIKADGLMGGKGVKVSGDHLAAIEEGLTYCQELIDAGGSFVIEEKFIGQEFSLMSFSDGHHLAHMPAVQDHKRAFVGDKGPNTGGMGSYSDANHLLPFLTAADIQQARNINTQTMRALRNECGEPYRGILYGGFMATKSGIKLIEYNARFGDPESMNVLAVLESDFVELCQAIINGNLAPARARFAHKATVCKYAVPEGYPDDPVKDKKIDISEISNKDQLYLGAVDEREDGLYETGSRAVAFVGIADTIAEAEQIAEAEIQKIKGPLFHREDIGTTALIKKRVKMMEKLKLTT